MTTLLSTVAFSGTSLHSRSLLAVFSQQTLEEDTLREVALDPVKERSSLERFPSSVN